MRTLYVELAVGLNLPSIEAFLQSEEPPSSELASKNVPRNIVAKNLLHNVTGDLWLALGNYKLFTLLTRFFVCLLTYASFMIMTIIYNYHSSILHKLIKISYGQSLKTTSHFTLSHDNTH